MSKHSLHITLFLSIFIVFGCGIPLPIGRDVQMAGGVRLYHATDSSFASFTQEFELRGRYFYNDQTFSIGDIPINFGDNDIENPDFKGVCRTYADGSKEILIRKSWWNTVSDTFKESLIFHELGHCRLGRDHIDLIQSSGGTSYKVSMMHSTIISPNPYTSLRDEYHRELYTRDTTELFATLGIQ